MDSFTQYYPSGSDSSGNSAGYSDVKLASSHPKKRAGRKKFKETRHPVYRGIRLRNNDKWVCELREPTQQKRVWLGTYPTAEMAARAHDVAALALRGKSACLNFADSSWRLPQPASLSPKDIRKAAGEAAEKFRRSREDHQQASETDQACLEVPEACDDNDNNNVATHHHEDMTRWSENMFSMDEDLPRLLLDMADGLLIDPPRFGDYTSYDDDVMISDGDVSLWSYSF